MVAHIAAPAEPAGLSIACDNEYTRNRILHFQRLDESGDYVDVPETEWGSLTPGAYCIQAATPVYIVDELSGPDHNVFYYRDTWKAYFFNGGIQKGQSSKLYTVGDYMFYFDLREGDGALTIQTDSDYPLATLTIEEGAPVDSIVLPISVDGEEIGVGISMPNDTIDPILLEEGRTYEVIASDKLVFTGATVTKTDVKYYPATYEPTYIYTISITENDGNGAVTIAKEPPVSITLSSGADAICEEYSMPGEGGWGWGGNGPYYSAGEYTFYEMGEELVITGAQDVSYDEDYTYTFTAAPGAVITIRLATESEDVFAPKATINLTAAAEALLTQWEYDNEGNIDWDGNVKYPVGEYAFTFSGEVEIDGVNNYDLRESEGQYIYTFTANANDIITIDVPVTTYTITVAGGIENGAVTANPTTAAENETVTLTVTPNAGYELGSLTVTDASSQSVTVNEDKTFPMPAANVTVNATFRLIPATEPTITTQPSNLSLTYGYMSGNVLTVAADSIDGHSLSYQWYSNTTDSNEGGTAINSATAASYTVPAGKSAGTTEYYYCVVTAKRNDNNQTAETKSNVATVTIGKATPDITTPPTASSITYGQTLNDSNLSDGAATTSGTFAWTNSSTTPAVSDSNTTEYGVTFTPSDTTNYNSATTTVTLTVNPKSVSIPTAVTGLKYTGSEQTGVAGGDGYTVENGTGTNVDSYTATATLTSTTNYKWSDGTTDAREISWSIAKADGPAAPTGLTGVAPTSSGASDGKITGVTTAMEYSEDGTDYTPCTGTEITGLTAGTYYVRTAATETQDAGAAATVNVPAYRAPSSGGGGAPATYPVTINGIDGGTVKPDKPTAAKGDKVTLTVTSDAGLEPTSVTVTDKNGKEVPVTDNGDGTYTFAMPAGAVSVTAAFQEAEAPADGSCKRDATCPISVFDDASPAGWYHDGVHYVLAEGIMQGTGATTFAPNSPTTRGMIVTTLWLMEGQPAAPAAGFGDVTTGSWYEGAVNWAADKKIVTGYSGEAFGPNDNVTREQLVVILYRYAQFKGLDVSAGQDTNLLSYGDAESISAWATEAMAWACGTGVLTGKPDGTLAPKANATRAEVATMLLRFDGLN